MGARRFSHKVADEILKLIDAGTFPPGSRLPTKRDLAEKFGVSRVSVREAELVLQAQGRIEVKPWAGTYVLSGPGLSSHGLPKSAPFELTEASILFEAESAALAAPIITDEALSALKGLISIISNREICDLSREEATADFHNSIARATNNYVVVFVIESMWKMRVESASLKNIYCKARENKNCNVEIEYSAIFEALENHDSNAARKAMRGHFTGMIEALLVSSEEEALREVELKASRARLRFLLHDGVNPLIGY